MSEIKELERRIMLLIAEREKQYTQRFAAEEKARSVALVAAERAVQSALTAAKEAVIKAELASEKRFDSVNEFRGQLKDQQQTLMPRIEAEARFKSIEDKIDAMKGSSSAGANHLWGIIATALVTLATVIGAIAVFRH